MLYLKASPLRVRSTEDEDSPKGHRSPKSAMRSMAGRKALFAGIYGQHGFCSRLDKRAFSGEGFSGKGPFECLFYCSFAVKVISVTVGLLNSRPFMG